MDKIGSENSKPLPNQVLEDQWPLQVSKTSGERGIATRMVALGTGVAKAPHWGNGE